MNVNKSKQAKEIIEKVAEDNKEMKDALQELQDLERQMEELAVQVLGSRKMQNEEKGYIGSEADNAMIVLACEQAAHDPEFAALLKKLDETDKQIAELTDCVLTGHPK